MGMPAKRDGGHMTARAGTGAEMEGSVRWAGKDQHRSRVSKGKNIHKCE